MAAPASDARAATSAVRPASAPGKRRAAKPTRRDRVAARNAEREAARNAERAAHEAAREAAREAKEQERAAIEAARNAERAARESARAAAFTRSSNDTTKDKAGSNRGGHTGGRKSLFPGLPSAPTMIGATALAFAAVGATVSQQNVSTPEYQKFASQASVLNAATSMGSSDAVSGRQRAVSRDSERQALQDAEDAELLAAAEDQAKERDAALAALAESAQKHAKVIARNAWQFALPTGTYRVSHSFGQCSYLWANCHTGEDFGAPYGTPILSIASGVVTSAGYDGSYGNKTVLTLDDGTEIWFCHQTAIYVGVGDRVNGGEVIGTVGATGNVTGSHLHLEVRPSGGGPVDPFQAFVEHGIVP